MRLQKPRHIRKAYLPEVCKINKNQSINPHVGIYGLVHFILKIP